jgi:hypothetical protein
MKHLQSFRELNESDAHGHNLSGTNFWTNGKEAAILDKDDKVIKHFAKIFTDDDEFTDEINVAMREYGFDRNKTLMLTDDTLEKAIMTLNIERSIKKMPLTIPEEKLKAYLQKRFDEFNKEHKLQENDNTFNYKLLGRLQADCEYYLGHGNRSEKRLWAGSVEEQIKKMKELWNLLPKKPEWLSMEDIEKYEKEMKSEA